MAARRGWRRALVVAALFGGFFAIATAARVMGFVLHGDSLASTWLAVPISFALFGGLGGLVALTNADAPERDPLTVSGWLTAGLLGGIVVFFAGVIVAGSRGLAMNPGWAGVWASAGWLLLLALAKAVYLAVTRSRIRRRGGS